MERRSYDVRIRDGSVRVEAWVREVGVELLICLHGLGCSSETFRDVWEYPDFDAYSILCPDLPGFGRLLCSGLLTPIYTQNPVNSQRALIIVA